MARYLFLAFSLGLAAPVYAEDRFDLFQWPTYEESRPWRAMETGYSLLFQLMKLPFNGTEVCQDMATYAMIVGTMRDAGVSKNEMVKEAEGTPFPISEAEMGQIELAYDRNVPTDELVGAAKDICLDSYDRWKREQ